MILASELHGAGGDSLTLDAHARWLSYHVPSLVLLHVLLGYRRVLYDVLNTMSLEVS